MTTTTKRAPGRPRDPNSIATQAKKIYDNYPDAANSRQALLVKFMALTKPDGTTLSPKAASVYYQIIKNPASKPKRLSVAERKAKAATP